MTGRLCAMCTTRFVPYLVIAFMSVGVLGSASPVEAASCINSYASGAAAPVGYAPAWNPLTAARELLVQGTDCTTSTATVKVGSGAQTQLVYNKGYYYTGSSWKEYSLTSTTALQNNAWYTGNAQASIQLPQEVTYVVGYVCQQQGSSWKCGCRDSACATSYWQLQAVKGAPALPPQPGNPGDGSSSGGYTNVGTGPQCAGATAPAPAAQHGLTKLAFCEDFSDPSKVNLGTTLNDGQTFTQVSSGNIFGSAPMPASAFSFSNGVMSVKPTRNNYQVNMISTVPTGGGKYKGFALKGSGWYAEIRWKHAACNMSTAFPAFWSMDLGHLYGGKFPILEPDFYEYIGKQYIGAIHNWAGSGKKTATLSTIQGMPVDPTQFFVAGAMAEPNNAAYAWYLNDKQMARRTAGWLSMFSQFASPIMFGSGPNCPYDVDYVRAWVKP